MSRIVLALALTVAACAPQKQQTPSPAEAAASAAVTPEAANEPVVGPPEVAWADMSKEQRGVYMKKVVMPKMQEAFHAFDPQAYEKITCATCHGSGAKDHSFKMPSADLPKLPSTPAGWARLQTEEAEWMKFMGGTVKPQMAALLGKPNFDPQNPQPGAFGCMGCHVTEGQ